MSKSYVNILNFKILYNILFEIKDLFKFDLHEYKNEAELFNGIKNQENGNFIVISKNFLKNDLINPKQIITPKDYPLNFSSLIEKINSTLLMQQYDFQSNFSINDYKLNLNSRIISRNNKELKLTQREIEVILFLKKNAAPVDINTLQKEVWGYAQDLETHTVETHVYRLRKKLNNIFEDDNFIKSEKEGYLIR